MTQRRAKELATRILREWYVEHKRSDLPALRDRIEIYVSELLREIDRLQADRDILVDRIIDLETERKKYTG